MRPLYCWCTNQTQTLIQMQLKYPTSSAPTRIVTFLANEKKSEKSDACRVVLSFWPRHRDKQRRLALVPRLIIVIACLRWPTVEMSCNYLDSYFSPSQFRCSFSSALFRPFLVNTAPKWKMLPCWKRTPVQCLFLFFPLLYPVLCLYAFSLEER